MRSVRSHRFQRHFGPQLPCNLSLILTQNGTTSKLSAAGRAVVMIGQAPVKLVGSCRMTDVLVPSGISCDDAVRPLAHTLAT